MNEKLAPADHRLRPPDPIRTRPHAADVASESPTAGAELESTLVTMQSMLRDAVVRHCGRLPEDDVPLTTSDPSFARNTLDDVLSRAKWSVSVVLPTDPRPSEVVTSALHEASARWQEGLRVRVLVTSTLLADARFRDELEDKPWLELRLNDARFPSVVIIDLACALVRTARPDSSWQASMIREIGIIEAIHAMFLVGWRCGATLHDDLALDALIDQGDLMEIIGCLAAGDTDEIAARKMRISVRTYRRYVARIMQYLGAASRFQAGVRAAELGVARQLSAQRPA